MRAKHVAIALLCGVGLLVAAELGLRAAFPMARSADPTAHDVEAHASAGFVYHPDLGWYWKNLPSPGSQVNEYGFRRVEPMTPGRPAGKHRMIVFGDSQVYGAGGPAEESFPVVAEANVEGWEVLNAGISGFRSLHIYRLLRLKMEPYEPDYILLDAMHHDSAREDGPLVARPEGATSRVQEVLWKSHLYMMGHVLLRIAGVRPWETLPWPVQLPVVREKLGEGGTLQGNWDLIAAWADARGIKTVFMAYPYSPGGAYACHTRFDELPQGYPVFDACKALRTSGRPASEMFRDHNHLTAEGNRTVGEALAAFLAELEPAAP